MCPNKLIKTFMAEDFFLFATGVNDNGWCTLSYEYLREFSLKFETALMVYSGAFGTMINEKTRSRKSRDTVPIIAIVNEGRL
jgi:hypothetical protein